MTTLPAVIPDQEQGPNHRCYELAAAMLRDHSIQNYHWARDFLAAAIWTEARNTLDYIVKCEGKGSKPSAGPAA
jgi:hypothetical protein